MRKRKYRKFNTGKRRCGFAADKPEFCQKCYFWNPDMRSCTLGGRDNCYYRISPPRKKTSPCDGCPYGTPDPCVSYCTMEVLGYFRQKKEGGRANG